MAYQGFARGLNPSKISEIHHAFLGDLFARCNNLMHITPEKVSKEPNIMEQSNLTGLNQSQKSFIQSFNGYELLQKTIHNAS
jgi:hypothetical protein